MESLKIRQQRYETITTGSISTKVEEAWESAVRKFSRFNRLFALSENQEGYEVKAKSNDSPQKFAYVQSPDEDTPLPSTWSLFDPFPCTTTRCSIWWMDGWYYLLLLRLAFPRSKRPFLVLLFVFHFHCVTIYSRTWKWMNDYITQDPWFWELTFDILLFRYEKMCLRPPPNPFFVTLLCVQDPWFARADTFCIFFWTWYYQQQHTHDHKRDLCASKQNVS